MTHRTTRPIRPALLAAACAGLLVVTACDTGGGGDAAAGSSDGDDGGFLGLGRGEPDLVSATTTQPGEEALVIPGTEASEIAAGTGEALFDSAPVAVLATQEEQLRGASAAVALGVPVLVDGPGTAEQLERLDAEVALALGPVGDPGIDVVVPDDDDQLAEILGVDADAVSVSAEEAASRIATLDVAAPELLVPGSRTTPGTDDAAATSGTTDDAGGTDDAAAASAAGDDATTTAPPAPLESDRDELPPTTAPSPLDTVMVLSADEPADLAALGTARAAGAEVLVGPHTDPRADSATVQALASAAPATVIGLGDGFGDSETLTWKARTAQTGVELPGGGQLVLPGKTYVALYGTPSTGALGVLGEQPIEETIERAEEHASWYEPLTEEPVIPTHEIIVTVASASAEADSSYSNALPIEEIEPLVDLAEENGHYVVLDLQPGRADFVTQAKMYEDLLVRPHVGLALDPEWRLGPGEVHLVQIGQADVAEVNEVVDWLADLTRDNDLPQKVLVLHMFQTRMIPDVDTVDQSREELAVLIHVDGQGGQSAKQDTWRVLHDYAPSIDYWGWKNFYDEDIPMLSPEETMSQVEPLPDFISYQ